MAAAPVKKERPPVADDQLEELKALLKRAQAAQQKYSTFSQAQVISEFVFIGVCFVWAGS